MARGHEKIFGEISDLSRKVASEVRVQPKRASFCFDYFSLLPQAAMRLFLEAEQITCGTEGEDKVKSDVATRLCEIRDKLSLIIDNPKKALYEAVCNSAAFRMSPPDIRDSLLVGAGFEDGIMTE